MSITCGQQRSNSNLMHYGETSFSKTCKSGKMQRSLRILLVWSWFVQSAGIQSWRDSAEIQLHSLIGVCTCMRVYMKSAGLDAQSERGITKKLRKKIARLITTWLISEHRNSFNLKMPAQSIQKSVFNRITPHSLVCRNIFISFFMIEACAVGLLCSARVRSTLFSNWSANRMIRGKFETFWLTLIG